MFLDILLNDLSVFFKHTKRGIGHLKYGKAKCLNTGMKDAQKKIR